MSPPAHVTRYSADCVRRPPMAKYIAPSLWNTRSVTGNGLPATKVSRVPVYEAPSGVR